MQATNNKCRRLIIQSVKLMHIHHKQQNDAILVGLSIDTMKSLKLRVSCCALMRKQEIIMMN